ncbi:MAG: ring-cleaving dioxygenase [Alphaproteobacteria bacterium]|nr:MAG: ring-cleaving dioxygenase [Alphaproteobacteria bacterium]
MPADTIKGFHHLTAMAADAAANIHFYTHVLGLRMVKVTVNFDDPGTYHLYYADQLGTPGTVITFFPWGSNAPAGEKGRGEISAFTLRVPQGTKMAWEARLTTARIPFVNIARPEGDVLELYDDSGHKLRIWAHGEPLPPERVVVDSPVPAAEQITEFAGVEFTVGNAAGTQALLEGTMGLTSLGNGRYGFAGDTVQHIDVLEKPELGRMHFGSASVHHLAFQVADDAEEIAWQSKLMASGQSVTEVKDRQYFHSIYLREPGGIILELATVEPGFAIDEPLDELGTNLKLPPQYEEHRAELARHLQPLPMVNYGVDLAAE